MLIAIRSRITGNVLYETEAASLREAVEKAVAAQVSLAGADLRNGDFRKGRFGGVDFRGADLRNADFSGAVLTGARMGLADCTGAKFVGTFIEAADLSGANLTRADLRGAKLARANLEDVVAIDTVMTGADVTDAKADLVVLTLAQFKSVANPDQAAAERLAWQSHHPHGPVRLNAVQAMYDACARLCAACDPVSGAWHSNRVGSAWEAAQGALAALKESARHPMGRGEATAAEPIAETLFKACRTLDEACKKAGSAQGADWKDIDRAHAFAQRGMEAFQQMGRGPAPLPDPATELHRARSV